MAPDTDHTLRRKTPSIALVSIAILAVGIVLFVLNLRYGSVSIPWNEFWDALLHGDMSTYRAIILDYRLPQAITALLAGIGLSVSGLLMQTLFRNPLADPSLLGISSGASLGVALVVLVTGSFGGIAVSTLSLWSTFGVAIAAFVGAFLVLLLSAKFKVKKHGQPGAGGYHDRLHRRLGHRHPEVLQPEGRLALFCHLGYG